mmetsp:Transcript_34082/g.90859  ORF Transcript_34082/g.90859 Transcript_34082/m.90859 type:complete len:359 (-) Transcript_34082:345-1421(-)
MSSQSIAGRNGSPRGAVATAGRPLEASWSVQSVKGDSARPCTSTAVPSEEDGCDVTSRRNSLASASTACSTLLQGGHRTSSMSDAASCDVPEAERRSQEPQTERVELKSARDAGRPISGRVSEMISKLQVPQGESQGGAAPPRKSGSKPVITAGRVSATISQLQTSRAPTASTAKSLVPPPPSADVTTSSVRRGRVSVSATVAQLQGTKGANSSEAPCKVSTSSLLAPPKGPETPGTKKVVPGWVLAATAFFENPSSAVSPCTSKHEAAECASTQADDNKDCKELTKASGDACTSRDADGDVCTSRDADRDVCEARDAGGDVCEARDADRAVLDAIHWDECNVAISMRLLGSSLRGCL